MRVARLLKWAYQARFGAVGDPSALGGNLQNIERRRDVNWFLPAWRGITNPELADFIDGYEGRTSAL